MPGVGPLTLDDEWGWYRSAPVAAGALGGAVGQIVVPKERATSAERDEVQHVVGTFLTTDDHALREAGPDVFAYYLDTARLAREQGWDVQLPVIAGPESVWDHVTFGREFQVDREPDVDHRVYISVECDCAWEPEHGLQLVFCSGRAVSKVVRRSRSWRRRSG